MGTSRSGFNASTNLGAILDPLADKAPISQLVSNALFTGNHSVLVNDCGRLQRHRHHWRLLDHVLVVRRYQNGAVKNKQSEHC